MVRRSSWTCLAVLLSALFPMLVQAQDSVPAYFWPQQQVLSLPLAGVVTKTPVQGSTTSFTTDNFDPASFVDPFTAPYFTHDAQLDGLMFESRRLSTAGDQLSSEYERVVTQLKELRGRLGTRISETPAADPLALNPIGAVDLDRIAAARSQILAVFPPSAIRQALSTDIQDGFPTQPLEDRVRAVLNPRALQFLAASLGLDLGNLSTATAAIVAQAIRHDADLDRYSIPNPTAPFQRVRFNDGILYAPGETTLPLSVLDRLVTNYCMDGTRYWEALSQTNLYSRDDYAVLAKWRIRGGNQLFALNTRTPVEQIQYECTSWLEDFNRFQRDIEILTQICVRATRYFVRGWPDPGATLAQRSDWLALSVVTDMGLDAAIAQGHRLDLEYAMRFIPQYIFAALGDKKVTDFGIDAATFANGIASVVGPLVADRMVSTQWELRASGVMGGLVVRPSKIDIRTPEGYEIGLPGLTQVEFAVDYAEPGRLFASAITNPTTANDMQMAIDDWRRQADAGIGKRREGFQERFRVFTEEVWKHYRNRVEWLQEALGSVQRGQDLATALRAINAPFGYQDVPLRNAGRVPLPADGTVVALHANVGEFGEAQRALATIESHLRRNARLFLTSKQLSELTITTGSAYRIELDPSPVVPANVLLVGVVHSVAPAHADEWAVDLEVFPAVKLATLVSAGTPGIAQLLPLEDRYCTATVNLLPANTCSEASRLLPRQGRQKIRVRERVQ
mgnify:CR=1 FL=1